MFTFIFEDGTKHDIYKNDIIDAICLKFKERIDNMDKYELTDEIKTNLLRDDKTIIGNYFKEEDIDETLVVKSIVYEEE